MKRVANLGRRGVWVRDNAGAFEVVFECEPFFSGRGEKLARLLGGDVVHFQPVNGALLAVVRYDEAVDRMVMDLIDLLVTLRFEHPTMVQLELQLGESEAEELERVLAGG